MVVIRIQWVSAEMLKERLTARALIAIGTGQCRKRPTGKANRRNLRVPNRRPLAIQELLLLNPIRQ